MLFDLDGVLVDVSGSYRAAIRAAAATFGIEVTPEQIGRMKARGNANNDWDVTLRLLTEAGVETTRDAVIERFEAAYQGVDGQPGLKATERAIVDRAWLEGVRTSLPMGIVTGRPRADAMEALERFGVADLFDTIVCMEDGPSKPEPDVVRVCMDRLGVRRAWMIGDTVDDIRAARAAGVVPIGVVPPGEHAEVARGALAGAGAARVLDVVDSLAAMIEGVAR
ncbi:MAG: HAD-IA family hydrolase, partial [Planctomycetota bacterium]